MFLHLVLCKLRGTAFYSFDIILSRYLVRSHMCQFGKFATRVGLSLPETMMFFTFLLELFVTLTHTLMGSPW